MTARSSGVFTDDATEVHAPDLFLEAPTIARRGHLGHRFLGVASRACAASRQGRTKNSRHQYPAGSRNEDGVAVVSVGVSVSIRSCVHEDLEQGVPLPERKEC